MRVLGGATAIKDHTAKDRTASQATTGAAARFRQAGALALKFAPPAALIVCALLLFWSAAQVFFVGDDYAWLYAGRTEMATAQGWKFAFTHVNGSGQYRPLTQQVFFWLNWHVFGMNALGYHLLDLGAFLATAFLIYHLLTRLVPSPWIAAGGAALWAFSMTHYESLDWVSAFSETGAVFFAVLTLVAAVADRRVLMLLGYLAVLLANETAIVVPALVLTYLLVWKGASLRDAIVRTLPLWGLFVLYMIARLTFLGLSAGGPFALVLSPGVWAQLTAKSVVSILGFNPGLNNVATSSASWSSLVTVVSLSLFISIAAVVGAALVQTWRAPEDTRALRLIALGVLWFLIGMAPVLPFAHNFADYNLSMPLLGFPLILAGLALAARRYGPALAVWVGVAYLAINALGGYGSGGLSQIDGVAYYGQQSRYAYTQMVAAEQRHPGRLLVSVPSDAPVVQWVVGNQWMADMVSHGSVVCYGTTTPQCMSSLPTTCTSASCRAPDLVLQWDDQHYRFVP